MAEILPATDAQAEFLQDLLSAGHLIESGVPGVYGHGDVYESVRDRLETVVSAMAADTGALRWRFPPVVPRENLERNGYVGKFPHLAASIFSFEGTESDALIQSQRAAAQEDWSEFQEQTALMMLPAACYPVYPAIAARGALPEGGVSIDMGGTWVFRHEPSLDPARRQTFRQHELVRMASPEEVLSWRHDWMQLGLEFVTSLGLEAHLAVASDPFFGRQGRFLAADQSAEELKFELLVPIAGPEPTACASFNYHRDHFGQVFGLKHADQTTAHTACVGFGQDRIVLALMRAHGLEPQTWPLAVRALLTL